MEIVHHHSNEWLQGVRPGNRALYLTLWLVMAGGLCSGFAQTYPIYVTPALAPPYSLRLSDYSMTGSQQLTVSIMVSDASISNLPVRLRIRIEGSAGVAVETAPNLTTMPLFLNGGQTTLLFGTDLADYFNVDNLIFTGYSKEQYLRTRQLPEGFYRFTVDVLHYGTNRVVSNHGMATAWIALGKPPVLKIPDHGAEVGQILGMPLTFSWLPSNVGVPAAGVHYTFELWELRIPGIDPNVIAASMPAFHTVQQPHTTLVVQPAELFLEQGLRYAWRVTAADPMGQVPFEQDGHSEVRTFTYQAHCDTATGFVVEQQSTRGTLRWEAGVNHTSFNVELRNPATGYSRQSQTFDSQVAYSDLDFGTTYRLRVQAVCNGDPQHVSAYSAWYTLSVPELKIDSTSCPDCHCGDSPPKASVTNLTLRTDLHPGDTISNAAGSTRFIIKTAEAQSDGVYKGQFWYWAEIWKVKILCAYWDLSVNTDNVVVNMDYESVSDSTLLIDVGAAKNYLDSLADMVTGKTAGANVEDTSAIAAPAADIYTGAEDTNTKDPVVAVAEIPDSTRAETPPQVIDEPAPDTAEEEEEEKVEETQEDTSNDTGPGVGDIPPAQTGSGTQPAEEEEQQEEDEDGDFEVQLFDGNKRSGRDSILLITAEAAMPDIRVKIAGNSHSTKKVELRLEISYQRDGEDNNGAAIKNLRNDVSVYPSSNDWQSVKINEEWDIDFGSDIRGGTALLLCRDDTKIDTVRFYIRGKNPTLNQIQNYLTQQSYHPQYWFIIKMTRQESSLQQFKAGTNYKKKGLTGTDNASGEPLYGKPRGFGLKQLDNWGNPIKHATSQHLWSWKANIDGGVEVIREKEEYVEEAKKDHKKVIDNWNKWNAKDPVSDNLTIIKGENAGSTALTITEGNETFAVNPSGNQRNIYDARWIKLFNGGPPYYQVNKKDAKSKPCREINRTNSLNKNYVRDVCSRSN
ncbi:MAG: hypothetical protein LBT49_00825 [Prevotellaceae bacterium]|jgi:hypothetical protein|nr:hypothetical protein [Prevotellaceae bacterium]